MDSFTRVIAAKPVMDIVQAILDAAAHPVAAVAMILAAAVAEGAVAVIDGSIGGTAVRIKIKFNCIYSQSGYCWRSAYQR